MCGPFRARRFTDAIGDGAETMRREQRVMFDADSCRRLASNIGTQPPMPVGATVRPTLTRRVTVALSSVCNAYERVASSPAKDDGAAWRIEDKPQTWTLATCRWRKDTPSIPVSAG